MTRKFMNVHDGASDTGTAVPMSKSYSRSFIASGAGKIVVLAQDMGEVIQELENISREINEEQRKGRSSSSHIRSRKEKDHNHKDKDHKEKERKDDGLFGLFHRRSENMIFSTS